MATRFFEHQEEARRQSAWLVFLFGCAVVGIVALTYLLAVAVTGLSHTDAYGRVVPVPYWQPDLFVEVGLAILAVVAGGSLYKIWQLRGGGSVVAEHLGGQLVPTDTRDPEERKLLNVVEEMAIASGTPTPPVYLLANEPGINAFAAGFSPSDAVIAVTRGSIQHLSRDELQGVIAHEFSHILNGDMRLNIRLMGAVHGILLIGIIGYFLLRSSVFAGGRRDSRDNTGTALLLAGFGLMVVGFLGTFFGNLIKASVSRQHEFLADASAVQFTRNPAGIAGALKKIAGLEAGSILTSPAAPEASHLYFSQGLRGGLQALFATHPPLADRIRRLEPDFTGAVPATAVVEGVPAAASSGLAGTAAAGFAGTAAGPGTPLPAHPEGPAIDQVGEPTAAHLDYAARLLAGLPRAVVAACHEPHGARAVLYALLVNRDEAARRRQLEQLARFAEPGISDETRRLLRDVEALDSRVRLPLVDLALPALRRLSPRQYAAFKTNVQALVEADEKIDLFEWTLQRILLAHLRPHFEKTASRAKASRSLSDLAAECSVVLSVLARFGSPGAEAVQEAFDQGAAKLPGLAVQLLPAERSGLDALDGALARLADADARAASQLLPACAVAIAADNIVSEAQGETMRAIADTLGAPMPPLLPGQRLA
jgi:Zn-dependent protease with chaperone function